MNGSGWARWAARMLGRLPGGAEGGIGLAESLVAIALMGVSAVTMVTALSTGSIGVRRAAEQATARALVTSQIEYIKGLPYDVSGSSYTALSAPEGYSVTISVDSNIEADNDIQEVTVAVSHEATTVVTVAAYKVNR